MTIKRKLKEIESFTGKKAKIVIAKGAVREGYSFYIGVHAICKTDTQEQMDQCIHSFWSGCLFSIGNIKDIHVDYIKENIKDVKASNK